MSLTAKLLQGLLGRAMWPQDHGSQARKVASQVSGMVEVCISIAMQLAVRTLIKPPSARRLQRTHRLRAREIVPPGTRVTVNARRMRPKIKIFAPLTRAVACLQK